MEGLEYLHSRGSGNTNKERRNTMSEYVRKTRDRWDIETNWGYGWETETCEYTWAEAKAQAKCYRENSSGRFDVRVRKHREPIEA